MIIMLVYFYLFVFQYFKFNSMFVIFLFSSANIQLFHSSPPPKINSPSPCAICLAFIGVLVISHHLNPPKSSQSFENTPDP